MSALVHVLQILACVAIAACATLGLLIGFCALAACMRSSQITRWEERQPSEPISVEPDPIESYPLQPEQPPATIVQPSVWLHREGALPLPVNPLGDTEPDLRVRS